MAIARTPWTLTWTVITWFSSLMWGAIPAYAPPPASQPAPSPIPGDVLKEMYRAELGPLYRDELFQKLYDAHRLVERYFTEPSARRQIVWDLEKLDVDPNLVGRITRIHLNWPADVAGIWYVNEKMGPHQVLYFVGVPEKYDRSKAWPLVIKLPTAHAFITKPPPGPEDVTRIYGAWLKEELAAHPDAIVLMPLLNLDELWGPSYPGMHSVYHSMLHLGSKVNINNTRVYLHGHAMSAHAAWNLALHYTTYFAAFNALAGGAKADWQRLRLMNLRNTGAIVWHDKADKFPIDESRQLVQILKGFKYPVEFIETANLGHAPSAEIDEKCYRRMREYRRDPYPRQIALQSNRPDTLFNRIDWLQVYQPMESGPEKRYRFQHGSGWMKVFQNAYTARANIVAPNRIDLSLANVGAMRLYFNDRMIDFSKPVTITLNGRPRFEGMLKPSYDEMLKDQLFLGRGWRYFTAVHDIEFGGPAPTTRKGVIEVHPPPGSTQPIRRIEK